VLAFVETMAYLTALALLLHTMRKKVSKLNCQYVLCPQGRFTTLRSNHSACDRNLVLLKIPRPKPFCELVCVAAKRSIGR
jgi:hypothetical protein